MSIYRGSLGLVGPHYLKGFRVMTASTATRRRTVAAVVNLPPLALLYTRISRDKEGRELGVTRQNEDLQERAEQDGVEVYGVYCDNDRGASPRSRKPRPHYARLLDDARRLKAENPNRRVVIYAYTSGRLTRRMLEHEGQVTLAEHFGVEYVFLRSPSFDLNTAAGRRIARILAANDTGEAEDISERVLRTFEQMAEQGKYMGGGRPFGYRFERDPDQPVTGNKVRLVLDPIEAKAIKDAYRLILVGEESEDGGRNLETIGSIARMWNRAGLTTPRGATEWSHQSVRSILIRGRVAGLVERHGEIVTRTVPGTEADADGPKVQAIRGVWEPIVTEEELDAMRERYGTPPDGRKVNRGVGRGRSLKSVGSGLYQCDKCSGVLRPYKTQGHRAYRCKQSHLGIPADVVDGYVRGVVADKLAEFGAALLAGAHAEEAAQLAKDAAVLRAMLDKLDDDVISGEISETRANARARKLEAKLGELDAARAELDRPSDALRGVADADDPVAAFAALPVDRQRAVIGAVVSVRIRPGTRGRKPAGSTATLTDRVQVTGIAAAA